MPGKRGATLVELIIASFITSLLMVSVFQFFNSSARLYSRGQTRLDLQSAALVAASNLTADLRQSALSTVTISNAPVALSLQLPVNNSTSPAAFVADNFFVVYFFDSGLGKFVRKIWPAPINEPVTFNPDPRTQKRRLLATELSTLVGTPNGTEKVLAANVQLVTFTPAQFPDVTIRDVAIKIDVSMHQDLNQMSKTDAFDEDVSSTVLMRNQVQP